LKLQSQAQRKRIGRGAKHLLINAPYLKSLGGETENRHWTPHGLHDPQMSLIQAQLRRAKKIADYEEKIARITFPTALSHEKRYKF